VAASRPSTVADGTRDMDALHDEDAWRARLAEPLEFLLQPEGLSRGHSRRLRERRPQNL
jgi:hypothetical protein